MNTLVLALLTKLLFSQHTIWSVYRELPHRYGGAIDAALERKLVGAYTLPVRPATGIPSRSRIVWVGTYQGYEKCQLLPAVSNGWSTSWMDLQHKRPPVLQVPSDWAAVIVMRKRASSDESAEDDREAREHRIKV
ncbi:hypothetical protein EV421DRAFT_1761823, partial [Armillaria borealis]